MTPSPKARDYMSTGLVTFTPDTDIHRAIGTLLGNRISSSTAVIAVLRASIQEKEENEQALRISEERLGLAVGLVGARLQDLSDAGMVETAEDLRLVLESA